LRDPTAVLVQRYTTDFRDIIMYIDLKPLNTTLSLISRN